MKKTLLSFTLVVSAMMANAQVIPTEIMYNAPGPGGNDLEFIELFNSGPATVALGGYRLVDAGNFNFVFPAANLAPGSTILVATNKAVADVFYQNTFLDIPGSGNFLGNGGELIQLFDASNNVVFSVNYDDAAPWPLTPDGFGPSLELLSSGFDPANGASWTASSQPAGSNGGSAIFASPGVFNQALTPQVSFEDPFAVVNENAGTVTIPIKLNVAGQQPASVTVSLDNYATATQGTDFLFEDVTVVFDANTQTSASIEIPILDDDMESVDRLFTLTLENLVNADPGENLSFVVYILDDEEAAPVATEQLGLSYIGSYLVDAGGSAEIVAYSKERKRLYVMNSTGVKLEIVNFSDPHNPTQIAEIDLSPYGTAGTSVACSRQHVAVTVDGAEGQPGSVVIFSTTGVFRKKLTVGYLPDMVTFTPNGRLIVVSNEGEPSAGYSSDPEGSVSVINVSGNVANLNDNDVVHIDFNDWDDQIDELRDAGVRIFGLNATVSKDLEPEFITISSNSRKAWVTLQENNAVARINLQTFQVEAILPLGLKDHSIRPNSIDVSDRNDSVFMANWDHLKGMYLPDAIGYYKIGNTEYVVTANEGDQREYGVINEGISLSDAGYVLDPIQFPDAALLKKNHMLGRLNVSPYDGDTDGDGDFDEIHAFGSRSFSIWNAATGALVYDSGDDFEKITANDAVYGALFNASNTNNTFKNRSDNKGPEPEGLTIAAINDTYYAFITLERTGGVLVYDITDPQQPVFEAYRNSRSLTVADGDLGPEGIIYIDAESSPNDTALVVIANEISATLSIFSLDNVVEGEFRSASAADHREPETAARAAAKASLQLYPNPAHTGRVIFSEPVSYSLYDSRGRKMLTNMTGASLDVTGFAPGIYLLVTADGRETKLVVE
jgi:hypothetical protein